MKSAIKLAQLIQALRPDILLQVVIFAVFLPTMST